MHPTSLFPPKKPASLGLYLHFPFCPSKCHHCPFASGVYPDEWIEPYLSALDAEIRAVGSFLIQEQLPAEEIIDWPVESVYLGGGTPSYLDASRLSQILTRLREIFHWEPPVEITVEVNPESASWEKFDALRQSGINRLSLGIQSGQDSDLQHLGRIHDTLQSRQAVLSARKAGFDNLSVDLIAGLPGQSIPGWRDSLEFALELDPEHISVYLLEIHPDTPYGRAYGPGTDYPTDRHLWPPLPEEELLEKMYFHTLERLGKAGYLQYEISNFAKPGFQSRHNLRYWQGMSVLGFGCGAFSNHGNHRWGNVRDLSDYVSRIKAAKSTLAEKSVSSPPERIGELFFLGMRTLPGISTGEFQQKTGLDLGAIFSGPLHFLVEAGLVRWTEGLLGLTPRGCLLSNEVFAEFLRFLDSSV